MLFSKNNATKQFAKTKTRQTSSRKRKTTRDDVVCGKQNATMQFVKNKTRCFLRKLTNSRDYAVRYQSSLARGRELHRAVGEDAKTTTTGPKKPQKIRKTPAPQPPKKPVPKPAKKAAKEPASKPPKKPAPKPEKKATRKLTKKPPPHPDQKTSSTPRPKNLLHTPTKKPPPQPDQKTSSTPRPKNLLHNPTPKPAKYWGGGSLREPHPPNKTCRASLKQFLLAVKR